ncbi:MAG: aspartyl protease family protein [Steroidobacteraceae bacterium]
MRIGHLGYMAALAALSLSSGVATAHCQLQPLGALPVDLAGLRPTVSARINGLEARFMLDTGAYYSIISDDAVAKYQLPVRSVSTRAFYIRGVGGSEGARLATVNSFEFIGVAVHKVQFLVIDQPFGDDYAGIFGQNLLRFSDVEYDLANGSVRFFKPTGCGQQPLAYWAVSTPYTAIELEPTDSMEDHLVGAATINGKRIRVWFDTGAPRSFLSLAAAERAGITPDSPGVTFLGLVGGIGPGRNKVWSAPVDSFRLGGEKVQHTHLLISDIDSGHRIGEVGDDMPEMLLGADFFLSHRIYVAYSQRKLYFTYNGGPLFNLSLPQSAPGAQKQPASPAASQTSAAAGEHPDSDTPTDPDGFKRRGMAYASMGELDRALSDLTRACDLAPRDADDHYDRAVVYVRAGQFKPALQDFTTTITLQPDDIDARVARAYLLQSHPNIDPNATPDVKSDLDAVARLAAPAANVRLRLAELYGTVGDYPAAVDQIDQWLSHRRVPGDQLRGLNARCWLRATSNRDLREALQDCNHALDLSFDDPDIRDSRGLVYLRLGKFDQAIMDYSSALRINPAMPTALYGRGLAELRRGEDTQGQADLAAARKLDSSIVKLFTDMRLLP